MPAVARWMITESFMTSEHVWCRKSTKERRVYQRRLMSSAMVMENVACDRVFEARRAKVRGVLTNSTRRKEETLISLVV